MFHHGEVIHFGLLGRFLIKVNFLNLIVGNLVEPSRSSGWGPLANYLLFFNLSPPNNNVTSFLFFCCTIRPPFFVGFLLRWILTPSVVDFNQRLGAVHSKGCQNMPFDINCTFLQVFDTKMGKKCDDVFFCLLPNAIGQRTVV